MKSPRRHDNPNMEEIHFRIIPQRLTLPKSKDGRPNLKHTKYDVCFEKGMQIVGKSTPLTIPKNLISGSFPPQKNLFDFQITNDKTFKYLWSLYGVDEEGLEERIEEKAFYFHDLYDKFKKSPDSNHHHRKITFDCGICLQFIILIQNTADYIMKLTSAILPEAIPADHKPNNKIKRQETKEQKSLQQSQSDKNKNSQGTLSRGKGSVTPKNSLQFQLNVDSKSASEILDFEKSKEASVNKGIKSNINVTSPIIEQEDGDMKASHKQEDYNKSLGQKYGKYGLILVVFLLVVGLLAQLSAMNKKGNKKTKKNKRNK